MLPTPISLPNHADHLFPAKTKIKSSTRDLYHCEIAHHTIDMMDANPDILTCAIGFIDEDGTPQQQIMAGVITNFRTGIKTGISFQPALFDQDHILAKLAPGVEVTLLIIGPNSRPSQTVRGKVMITGEDGFVILDESKDSKQPCSHMEAKPSFFWNETHQRFGQSISLSDKLTANLIFTASLMMLTMARKSNSKQAPIMHAIKEPASLISKQDSNELLIIEQISYMSDDVRLNISIKPKVCLTFMHYDSKKIVQLTGALKVKHELLVDGMDIRKSRNWCITVDSLQLYEMYSQKFEYYGEAS